MLGCLKLPWRTETNHAKPDCPEPNHAESNKRLHHQITMCTQKKENNMTKVN
jgi:hypothetical protein